ncbi:MAG: cation:proton antiporter [Oceanospirillaceae bacterium]|nr:cation:proton antiporter [Oceanospirillaceae bacterium]
MPHEAGSVLQTIVVFLLAAVVMVPLAKKLQLGAVLGYLFAGVLIGPSVLGLIQQPESVSHISELGVVLLLFIIGLELSPRRLWVMRKSVFGAGLAQVLACGISIGLVAWLAFAQPPAAALVLGLGLALSSTAFGLQLLAERKELQRPHGRLAFAILLFQDIAAIPLIALVPLLSGVGTGESADSGWLALLKVIGSIGLVVIGGRYLLRPVFRVVVKTGLAEVSTATALLVVIGTAWLMELAGISMALGAFLAGLLLADSEYRHELEAQIDPFKGLLLGLFFISVGMTANIGLLAVAPLAVLGLTCLLILLKLPLLFLVGRLAGGLTSFAALKLGVVLATGGEFAFVVFQMAREQGLIAVTEHSYLVLVITLSMAVTPLIVVALSRLPRSGRSAPSKPVPDEYKAMDHDTPRVLIAGMGRMGQMVSRLLHAQRIPFVALDTSVETIELHRSFGQVPIFYGDPLRPEILRAAQAPVVDCFVIATNDAERNHRIVEQVRRLYPHIKVIVRARDRRDARYLRSLGAMPIREAFFSSLEMGRETLLTLGLEPAQADIRVQRFRQHDEDLLEAQYWVRGDEAALLQTAREARAELEQLFESDLADDVKPPGSH